MREKKSKSKSEQIKQLLRDATFCMKGCTNPTDEWKRIISEGNKLLENKR